MLRGYRKPCDQEGCAAPVPFNVPRCDRCELAFENGVRLWASLGVRELGELLAAHARFDAWDAAHP